MTVHNLMLSVAYFADGLITSELKGGVIPRFYLILSNQRAMQMKILLSQVIVLYFYLEKEKRGLVVSLVSE